MQSNRSALNIEEKYLVSLNNKPRKQCQKYVKKQVAANNTTVSYTIQFHCNAVLSVYIIA